MFWDGVQPLVWLFGLLVARADFPVLLIRFPGETAHSLLILLELDFMVEGDTWSVEMLVVCLMGVSFGLPYFSDGCLTGM